MSRALALSALLSLAACLEPTQYQGPITVDQRGLRHRLGVLCHVGAGDDVVASTCPAPSAKPQARRDAATAGSAVAAER